jgi:predicted ferric reductase
MKKGHVLIGAIVIITVACWLLTPAPDIPFVCQLSQLLGVLALAGFAMTNFISTRHSSLDPLFNGLDKAYVTHKWLGISSLFLAFAHFFTINMGRGGGHDRGREMGHEMGRELGHEMGRAAEGAFSGMGNLSALLFVVLILVAVLAKRMNYEKWKTFHKFMLVPYAFGLVHYYGSSSYETVALTPFSIWVNLINLIGILSVIYTVFIYGRTAYTSRYKVSSAKTVASGTIEITGTALNGSQSWKPGQFAFIKGISGSEPFPSHPFTISSAPNRDTIQFTIKNLGKHTAKLVRSAKAGDVIAVSKPHGMFDYTKGSRQQIWIAGGIGITPFRSCYQAGVPEGYSVDFFYAYNKEEDGAYLEELRAIQATNLRIHLIDGSQQGYLTAEKIRNAVSIRETAEREPAAREPVDVYFCGPKQMRNSLKKTLESSGFPVGTFHYDEFGFGR